MDKPFELKLTLDALSDLETAFGWIADYSDEAAKIFLAGLRYKLEVSLPTTPHMGVQLQLADGSELYAVTSDQYRIFYGVDDEQRTLTVFRILHTSRNINRILKVTG